MSSIPRSLACMKLKVSFRFKPRPRRRPPRCYLAVFSRCYLAVPGCYLAVFPRCYYAVIFRPQSKIIYKISTIQNPIKKNTVFTARNSQPPQNLWRAGRPCPHSLYRTFFPSPASPASRLPRIPQRMFDFIPTICFNGNSICPQSPVRNRSGRKMP
jgi:hypothetical protein